MKHFFSGLIGTKIISTLDYVISDFFTKVVFGAIGSGFITGLSLPKVLDIPSLSIVQMALITLSFA